MVDFIITDFSNVRGGGNIVDSVPSAEDFVVEGCTISSSSSGVFVLTPGESLVGNVWLSANPTSITVGGSVVFSAFVEDTDGEPLEDLTVSFYRDGVSLGSGVSDDTGLVQLTVSSWSVGSFTCTASCQGVTSSAVTVTVNKISSTISLSAVSSTISVGDSPQLTGTLSVGSGESVKIYLGDVLVDTVTTGTNGAFSFTGSATSTSGSLTFKAVYDGDSTHSSVTSSNVVITVSGSTPVVTSVSLTSDKSVLSAYDSESAVLSATVLDDNDAPMEGETVTFYKGSTSIGTATTNSSGIATKSYSATGSGDVTFKASVGMIVSETYSITDSIIYRSSEISKSNKTSSAKNEVIINDIGVDLADMNFEFSFDGKFTGTDGILCIGYSNSVGQYRVHIGAEEDANRSLNWGYRTTTTTSSNGSGRIENQWYNMKIIRNGTNFDYYIDNVKVDTKTTNFMSSYHSWALYIQLWKNNSSVTVKNLKLKPL